LQLAKVYLFLLEGSIEIEDNELQKRDGIGIWDTDAIKINATSNSEFLIMEIPMNN
jgi:redox-sensitive bicupin YhaK (pirin superfamily)